MEPERDEEAIIKFFRKDVDTNDIAAMREFLEEHYRYNTMNSWNNSTSYANRVKLHGLPLTDAQLHAAYDLMDIEDVWDAIRELMHDFAAEHKFLWQVGFNGRSGGYIVLYQGERRPDGKVCVFPGKGTDHNAEFDEWDIEQLRDRVTLVSEFDHLCDLILTEFVYYIDNYDVEEQEIMIPKTIKVLVEKA